MSCKGVYSPAASYFVNVLASLWVDAYHAVFISKDALERENNEIRMHLIQGDLSSCQAKLTVRENELQDKVDQLTDEIRARLAAKDRGGAKRKLADRQRNMIQLDKLRNSMAVIDLHVNTIEGTELDKSILSTLKASGDALKKLGVEGGVKAAEEIISDVEGQLLHAADITNIISSGSVSGLLSSYSIGVDDDELEKELDEMMREGSDSVGHTSENFDTMLNSLPSVPNGILEHNNKIINGNMSGAVGKKAATVSDVPVPAPIAPSVEGDGGGTVLDAGTCVGVKLGGGSDDDLVDGVQMLRLSKNTKKVLSGTFKMRKLSRSIEEDLVDEKQEQKTMVSKIRELVPH